MNSFEPSTGEVVKSLKAREVFTMIVDLAWLNGEPGVLFIDAANKANPTPQLGLFEALEVKNRPLPPYSAIFRAATYTDQTLMPPTVEPRYPEWAVNRQRRVGRLATRQASSGTTTWDSTRGGRC